MASPTYGDGVMRATALLFIALGFLIAAHVRADVAGDATQTQRRRSISISSADVRPVMVAIPAGSFQMGDHHGFVDPSHPSDELPLHTVQLSAFYIGRTDVTVQQYREFLAAALSAGTIRVASGIVYLASGTDPLFLTRTADQYSRIGWDGTTFTVLDAKGSHPVTSVLWHGAAAYCNWLSAREGKTPSYDTTTWTCDFTKDGYRLPTEAEWEYAGRGGATTTYWRYPWGNTPEKARANWPSSGDPYESGSLPWTTPVAFYDGTSKSKSDFGWPGSATTYQTSNGANGFGLYDMAGNVWQWCNDWYGQSYYSSSPSTDPTGPTTGTPMPDGKPYRVLRGGNWFNGDQVDGVDDGHSRVSNRDPSYYRGPQDPNHPWYHVGFRPARRDASTVVVNTGTVGLFVNTSGAYPGYTLFAPKHNTSTYLIDNEGRVVHKWTGGLSEPGQSAIVMENGHLMRATMTRGPLSTGGGEGGRIEEFDWDSNLVWQLDWSTALYMQHHDFRLLPNGNVLVLAVEKKTVDEALAAGFNPSKFQTDITKAGYMLPDYVVEIQPTRPVGGKIVWEWHVWDHLIQDYSASKANYGDVAAHPERIDAAGDGKQIPSFWNHMNAIYYNAARDEIVLSVRGNSEAWVIDHSTTTAEAASRSGGKRGKGGDLLYRWGNPSTYRLGATKDQMLFQQHDVRWIEEGCPGAGNFTAFNNGLGRNYSTIDEWTPPIGSDGNYTRTTGAAFGPSTLTWQYTATPPASLFAEAISSAQRLPNGNTLICDGTHGTFTEVTSSGTIVWKYVNSVITAGPLAQGASIPEDAARAGEYMNAVFRVQRYPLTYAGFSGRDLTPTGRVEIDPRPVAIFTFSPAAPAIGQSVTFTDRSANTPTAWSWSFGDGGTSTQQSPTHTYAATGTYTVTLTATNSSGRDVTTRTITVTGSSLTVQLDDSIESDGASTTIAIPDTGQTSCFNANAAIACPAAGEPFYGQDAQVTRSTPSYSKGADGLTVKDHVTGLTWQRSPDTNGDGTLNVADKMTWTQAQARPAALNAISFGGYSDWRLPTIKELYSLINFAGTDPSGVSGTDTSGLTPFIETKYFQFAYGDTAAGERIIDSQYASGTLYVANPSDTGSAKLFGVNFADGRIKGYDLSMPGGASKTFFVQCVRGPVGYGVNSFVNNGDGTITDQSTGLMWSRSDSGSAMRWEDALAWVQAANAANHLGHNDWRMPDAKELQSIVDYTRSPDTSGWAAIDPMFDCTSLTNEGGRADFPWYWTSTTHASIGPGGISGGNAAVYIAFGRATGWMKRVPGDSYYTLYDVHGAGAQRSDPKTGTLASFAMGSDSSGKPVYGRGPQGDVIRLANYVRLVRTAPALQTMTRRRSIKR